MEYTNSREEAYYTFNPYIDHEWVDHEIENIKYRVYKNINFSIFITDYCNACCKFCIEQVEYRNKKQMLLEKERIVDDEEYLSRLRYVLEQIKPLNPSISITGGEPSMSHRFCSVLHLLAEFSFRKVTINTNGSGLKKIVNGQPLYQHIIECGISHVNISRHHWNDEYVNEIMRFEHDTCSSKQLEEIVPILNSNGVRVRINCVVLDSYIDNIDKIVSLLEYYIKMGIDNVVFRQMMEFNLEYVRNDEIIGFYATHLIKIDDIMYRLDNDERFKKVKSIKGRYYYVEIWKYKNVDIVGERESSVVKNRDIGYDEDDLIYELIFHPAGTVTKGWYYKKGIVMGYGKYANDVVHA